MDFNFSDEQRMIRDMVRDFARNDVLPGVEEREKNAVYPKDIIEKAAGLGLCGIAVDPQYGGAGFDGVSAALAIIELAKVDASTAITLSVNNGVYCWPVENFASPEQKEKFLRPAASGETLGAFCLTEPDAGSDAANISTKATQDGEYYVLEGTKAWVTNGGVAGLYVVIAITGERDGRKELSAFVVPADLPGVRVAKIEDKMGLRSSKTAMMVFDGARVPAENLFGGRGSGLKIALATLDQSRIGVAAQALGIARGAWELAIEYANMRKTFGVPLAKHQAVQFMLADMGMEISAAELLTFRAASLMDAGQPYGKAASMSKLHASETAKRVCDMAVQIHGAYGYSREYAVERMFRDVRVTTIYEGTSEIQKMVIARHLLKELA
jgi:alkylation response protein AidB-like acyl-CoA dehydrogenase